MNYYTALLVTRQGYRRSFSIAAMTDGQMMESLAKVVPHKGNDIVSLNIEAIEYAPTPVGLKWTQEGEGQPGENESEA